MNKVGSITQYSSTASQTTFSKKSIKLNQCLPVSSKLNIIAFMIVIYSAGL